MMHDSKSIIREWGKRTRAELGDEARADLDEQIIERCRRELPWGEVRSVMVFLPIARQNEIDTWPLVRWLWREHADVAVYAPRVAADDLEVIRLRPETAVRMSDWGIPEPQGGEVLRAGGQLDLVLAPLLAFDKSGHRVGYGRGYYDRLFQAFPKARRVGLGYECLLVRDGIPAESRDVQLQAVVTEHSLRKY